MVRVAGQTVDALKPLADFHIGEMKFPETKIGEIVTQAENWLKENVPQAPQQNIAPESPPQPPRLPLPPPLRPRIHLRKNTK
jgi:hypothetical protein